jgi:hypothetical protein
MTKVRTTLTIEPEVLRAVKVRAARLGKGDSEVIEEALRRDLGLELLDRLWAANDLGDIMVLATPASSPLDPSAPISCEWRRGDVW